MIPFVTEEIWKSLDKKKLLMIETWPKPQKYNFKDEVKTFNKIKTVITEIRNIRATYKVKPGDFINAKATSQINNQEKVLIEKLGRIKFVKDLSKEGAVSLERLDLALGEVIDIDTERKRLEKEKIDLTKYLSGLEKKLNNKKYL